MNDMNRLNLILLFYLKLMRLLKNIKVRLIFKFSYDYKTQFYSWDYYILVYYYIISSNIKKVLHKF